MVSRTTPESRKSTPYKRVSRSRTRIPDSWDVRPMRIPLLDPVTRPGNGLDDGRLAQFRPEAVHGGLPRGGERVGGRVPHPFQELLGGDHPALRGEQVLQDGQFLGAQRQPRPTSGRDAPGRVQREVTADEDGGYGGL